LNEAKIFIRSYEINNQDFGTVYIKLKPDSLERNIRTLIMTKLRYSLFIKVKEFKAK